MTRARTCPWIRIRPYRGPLKGQGIFFAVQFSADCITNISGFDLRQAQARKLVTADPITIGMSSDWGDTSSVLFGLNLIFCSKDGHSRFVDESFHVLT
jgi:hypothetical protein